MESQIIKSLWEQENNMAYTGQTNSAKGATINHRVHYVTRQWDKQISLYNTDGAVIDNFYFFFVGFLGKI